MTRTEMTLAGIGLLAITATYLIVLGMAWLWKKSAKPLDLDRTALNDLERKRAERARRLYS